MDDLFIPIPESKQPDLLYEFFIEETKEETIALLPKFIWSINPSAISSTDICLYHTNPQKDIIHLPLLSPFKVSTPDLKYFTTAAKLFKSIELLDPQRKKYIGIIDTELLIEFDSKTIETLYLSIRKTIRTRKVPKKFLHLYLMTGGYIKCLEDELLRSLFKGMVFVSRELGKYKASGSEKDFISKLNKYLSTDKTVQTSHTFPFILAILKYCI